MPEGDHPPSQRVDVLRPHDEREVFRFVRVSNRRDSALIQDFLSDAALGKTPRGRSAAIPGHMDGMSAFRTLELAEDRWADIALLVRRRDPLAEIRAGHHIARVVLTAGSGFAFEDLERTDGHLTIWGEPPALARAVAEIVPAER